MEEPISPKGIPFKVNENYFSPDLENSHRLLKNVLSKLKETNTCEQYVDSIILSTLPYGLDLKKNATFFNSKIISQTKSNIKNFQNAEEFISSFQKSSPNKIGKFSSDLSNIEETSNDHSISQFISESQDKSKNCTSNFKSIPGKNDLMESRSCNQFSPNKISSPLSICPALNKTKTNKTSSQQSSRQTKINTGKYSPIISKIHSQLTNIGHTPLPPPLTPQKQSIRSKRNYIRPGYEIVIINECPWLNTNPPVLTNSSLDLSDFSEMSVHFIPNESDVIPAGAQIFQSTRAKLSFQSPIEKRKDRCNIINSPTLPTRSKAKVKTKSDGSIIKPDFQIKKSPKSQSKIHKGSSPRIDSNLFDEKSLVVMPINSLSQSISIPTRPFSAV